MWKYLILLKGVSYFYYLRVVLFIFEVFVKLVVKVFKINYVWIFWGGCLVV